MNCKPGDLAVVVRSKIGNHGAICIVVKCDPCKRKEHAWVIDIKRPLPKGKKYWWIFDSQIRPLRDNPGQDETLQWINVPSTDKVGV